VYFKTPDLLFFFTAIGFVYFKTPDLLFFFQTGTLKTISENRVEEKRRQTRTIRHLYLRDNKKKSKKNRFTRNKWD